MLLPFADLFSLTVDWIAAAAAATQGPPKAEAQIPSVFSGSSPTAATMSAEFFDRHVRDKVGVRRLGSRSPPDPDSSRVKRALFGPVDHEENKRFFKREFDRDLDEKKRQYNFDFETERALDGRWEWKKVAEPGLPALLALEVRTRVSEIGDDQDQSQERVPGPVSPQRETGAAPEKPPEPLEDAREPSPEAASIVCDKTSVSKAQASNSSSRNQRKSTMPGTFCPSLLPCCIVLSINHSGTFPCRFFPTTQASGA